MVTIIYWNEPSTGNLEHGYYLGRHGTTAWDVVLWNSRPHQVNPRWVVRKQEVQV